MKLKKKPLLIQGRDGEICLSRTAEGVSDIKAVSLRDGLYGLGRLHMQDRQIQMVLTKLILQGRLSEFISAKSGLLETDIYIRKLLLFPDMDAQLKRIGSRTRAAVQAYVDGINDYIAEEGRGWELKLAKIENEPWSVADVMHMAKVFSYFGLVDAQGNMEKFIVQMVQKGIDERRLKELFPYLKEKLDVELLKKVKLEDAPVDAALDWLSVIPKFRGSNNWAVSGKKSVSGKPILAGDPHLEVNRMPAIWYDSIIRLSDNTIRGYSMPGMPAILMGRTDYISYSPTYSFADMIDYRIEECSGGKYKRGRRWIPFEEHREIVRFKDGREETVTVYENEHGVLEGNPFVDGFYLVRSWSCHRNCGAEDLNAALEIMEARSVREAMRFYRCMESPSFCFAMADVSGNIGFQMTGRVFKRPAAVSGLLPTPGWERRYSPMGFIDTSRLPSDYNPECGYVITANNDLNRFGTASPINLPVAGYRYDRIKNIISGRKDLDVEVMMDMQYDLYSMQAESIVSSVKDLIPDCEKGMKLKNWDFRYDENSDGAAIFENLYESLLKTIFGSNGFGENIVEYMLKETSLFNDYFGQFDRVIMSEKSLWFMKASGRDLKRMAVERALAMPVQKYGRTRSVKFKHLLFGDRFPSWFGFDLGPMPLPGGRATILQGQIFKSRGRLTTFSPSARIVSDMADDFMYGNMPGGTSDRRFSRLYKNNMAHWLRGTYKRIF